MRNSLTPLPAASDGARGTKILVVDDELVWRRILATDLNLLGYEAVVAADANEALGQIGDTTPGAAIIDLMLPGPIDGRGLAARLQQRLQPIPVLFYSAAYEASLPPEELEGAFAFISKAAERAELYSLLARALA